MNLAFLLRAVVSAATLCGLSLGGDWLTNRFSLPVPGPVLGMIVLLAVLTRFPDRVEWLTPAADLLLKWMGVLVVPSTAGVVLYPELFREHGLALVFILLVTTIASGLACSWMYLGLVRRRKVRA
jgi:holin-like protein